MKNFLVKMSRNRRIMVPAVTLLALSIGIGGYYVDNQKVLKEEARQNQQNLDIQAENARLKKEQKVNHKDKSSDSDKNESSDESDSNSSTAVQYVVNVEATENGDKVNIKATIEGTEPGECFITLKQGSYGPEDTVSTLGGTCEVTFDKPGSGEWNVNAVYTSSDSKQTGSGTSTIQL